MIVKFKNLDTGATKLYAASNGCTVLDAYRAAYGNSDNARFSVPADRRLSGQDHESCEIHFSVVAKPAGSPRPAAAPAPCLRTPVIPTPTPAPRKEISTMFNLDGLKSKFFSKIAFVVIDILSGKIGIKASDGEIKVMTLGADGPSLTTSALADLAYAIPAFAIRTPVAQVKKSDILVLNGVPVFVTADYADGKLQLLKTDGSLTTVIVATDTLFQDKSVLRVTNPFASADGAGLQAALPMLLLAAGEGEGMADNLGLMLALSGGLGGDSKGGINPLMLMALGGKGGAGGIDPMMLMALSGGLGGLGGDGKGGINPLMLMAFLNK